MGASAGLLEVHFGSALKLMNAQTLTYLQPGMIVEYDHNRWKVAMVNECRAKLQCLKRPVREFTPATGPNAGKRRRFRDSVRTIDISPNSQLPILENA